MTKTPDLDVKTPFQGVVVTMDWVRMPDGKAYMSFRGMVSIMSAEDAVGWVPTGYNSANWLARVQGPTMSINLMGCQVRAVLEGDVGQLGTNDQLVMP
jgi:hypothetical protein